MRQFCSKPHKGGVQRTLQKKKHPSLNLSGQGKGEEGIEYKVFTGNH